MPATVPPDQMTITLLHKNCGRNCSICAYGKLDPISYERIETIVERLSERGYRVQLYDFDVTNDSIAIFRKTRQFEGENPGWMNVVAGFDPTPPNIDYINQLKTSVVISLHGSTAEVHHRSSGKKDYDDIIRFLEAYPAKFTRPLGINYVVGKRNADDVSSMIRFAHRFDLEFLEFIPLGFTGNALGRMGKEAIMTDAEKYAVYRTIVDEAGAAFFDVEMDAIWGPDFARNPNAQCKFFAAPIRGEYCNAGINHFAIRLNDSKLFPCPCMASVDDLACGTFDGDDIVVEENWMEHKDRIGEPCRSCDKMSVCQGGCRLTALSDYRIEHGDNDRFAGFKSCLYALTVRYG